MGQGHSRIFKDPVPYPPQDCQQCRYVLSHWTLQKRYFQLYCHCEAEVVGHVSTEWGPLAGTPISSCLGDQHAALLGQRCQPGQAKATYGTGCFLLYNTGLYRQASSHGLLSTMAFKLGPSVPPQYALEGAIAIAGAAVQWLRDSLGIIKQASEIEDLAGQVKDTGGLYFVPAFGGLFAPRWREDARGVLVGISRYTGRAHIALATLEGIAFQVFSFS